MTKTQTNSRGHTLPAVAFGATTESKPAEATSAKRVAGSKPRSRKADKVVEATAPVVDKTPHIQPVVDENGNPLPIRRSIVPKRFKQEYKAHGGTCGDDMALELKAATTMLNADKRTTLDWAALKAIAEANGIHTAAYESLNNGQKRMNVGNKLRGLLAEGKDVVVGTRTFKAEDWTPKTPRKPVQQAAAN